MISENKRLWDNVWNDYISSQEQWNEIVRINIISSLLDLSKHNLVNGEILLENGSYRKEPKYDFRVPATFLCGTTAGKDLSGILARMIMKKMGYKVSRSTDFTTASVVGSTDQTSIKYNAIHGLTKNSPSTEGSKGKIHNYKDPIIYGTLFDMQYWTITEMEMMLNSGQHRQGILIIFRQMLDNDRWIEKNLAGVHIEYKSPTNCLFATYPKDKVIYFLMDSGLFQRMLFLYNDVDEKTEEIEDHQIDRINKQLTLENGNFDNLVNNFNNQFKDINSSEITFDDSIKEVLKQRRNLLRSQFEMLASVDISILNSVMRRGINIIKNIARCYAVDNNAKIVGKLEINQAFDLFEQCMLSLKNFLAKMNDTSKLKIVLLEIFGEFKKLPSTNVVNGIMRTYKIKYVQARNKIKTGIIQELITEKDKEICILF